MPSGYAERSWWIVTGQQQESLSDPAVLVTSRQWVYGKEAAIAPEDIELTGLEPTRVEEWVRDRLPEPLARAFHVDSRALERSIVLAAQRHDAQILHVHWSSAIGDAVARAAIELQLPVVAEVRFDLAGAMGAQSFRGRVRWLEQLVRHRFERHLQQASVIVAASDALAGLLQETFPSLSDSIHVIANGVDSAFVNRCDESRKRASDNARVTLGTTSKMLRYENLDALIRVCETRDELDLIFVGDGPERARLEALAAPLNQTRNGRVRFTGPVARSTIASWLAAIDIFVVPRQELAITRYASPLKVVEAMAAARAVVATRVGDMSTLLADDHGVLVDPHDQPALERAIDDLAQNEQQRLRLGQKARRRMLQDYDGASLLQRYSGVYRSALART